MKYNLWELVKLTGDVKYYMMYKKIEEVDTIGEIESKSDSD